MPVFCVFDFEVCAICDEQWWWLVVDAFVLLLLLLSPLHRHRSHIFIWFFFSVFAEISFHFVRAFGINTPPRRRQHRRNIYEYEQTPKTKQIKAKQRPTPERKSEKQKITPKNEHNNSTFYLFSHSMINLTSFLGCFVCWPFALLLLHSFSGNLIHSLAHSHYAHIHSHSHSHSLRG